MFDPTAFENMKVVIEGALYDLDLSGDIFILDRNDIINSAKLSRKYEITFTNDRKNHDLCNCSIIMEAGLENLAAELLQAVQSERLSGCKVLIKFSLKHPDEQSIYQKIEKRLEDIWGQDRAIDQAVSKNPLITEKMIRNDITISFNRLVYEDQMTDLIEMIDYMLDSLEKLRRII
ncbi:hypothetical protein [Bacillus sp. S/N-304-OC-R1]|uniref:hypothetical protein n=1 Tax=Bacillus sp. S/N-304-OC-R1 TaxID=2758034 RepID=UPI001C8E399E|nr:hypothetical protein [Bacillus sp. S/N-304-OC-R1]MBY0122681.1 hypothetical protein [Bacillus sp. S/N-304-OC-R1]